MRKKIKYFVLFVLFFLLMFWFISFKPIVYSEGREMVIKTYPGPTEIKLSDTDEIKHIIDQINNEKKMFSGLNFESGGWEISISYNHQQWFISDSQIVKNNLQYNISRSLIENLKIIVENLSD